MTFKRLTGFYYSSPFVRITYVDGQVDGELSAATLYGSIWHRPQ